MNVRTALCPVAPRTPRTQAEDLLRRATAVSIGLAALLLAGCRAPERGVVAAEHDLARGDLTSALLELDSVIPADPDYARARSLAAAVERRMRSAQRFLGQGLKLRAEWRDDDALAAFQASLEVWPGLDGVDELIAATRIRRSALGPRDVADEQQVTQPAPGFVATTRPVDLPARGAAPAVETGVVAESAEESPATVEDGTVAAAEQAPTAALERAGPVRGAAVGTQVGDAGPSSPRPRGDAAAERLDPAARQALDGVRDRLRAGDVERALEALEALCVAHPRSAEVAGMLGQVLHQKALLHYGQGDLGVAIETWERLLEQDRGHEGARAFLRAARTELGEAR